MYYSHFVRNTNRVTNEGNVKARIYRILKFNQAAAHFEQSNRWYRATMGGPINRDIRLKSSQGKYKITFSSAGLRNNLERAGLAGENLVWGIRSRVAQTSETST